MSYAIITPVKNELNYFRQTIASVCSQSLIPIKWIIMDDGSTDGTNELINEFSAKYSFIEHHYLENYKSELNSIGGRSGALMNLARKHIPRDVKSIVKIDADIAFPNYFISHLLNELKKNPTLGIASGHLLQNGIPELIKDYNANRGAVRVYRKMCFDQIGSYYMCRGEDDMDTYTAQYLGWETKTFDIYFDHLKPEEAKGGDLSSHFETGYYKGKIPYILVYFLGASASQVMQRPLIIGAMAQLLGYISSRYIHRCRPFDKDVCDFIRFGQQRKLKEYLFHPYKNKERVRAKG